MKSPRDDTEIKRLFDRLSAEEAPRVPPLERILERSPAILKPPHVDRLRLGYRWVGAGALALVVLIAVSLLTFNELRRNGLPGSADTAEEMAVASLMDWDAPTDFLLEPDREDEIVQSSVPTLETEMLDWSENGNVQPDGAP